MNDGLLTDKQKELFNAFSTGGFLYYVLGGGTGCFVKGTKVRMFDGSLKNIEDIQIGDVVLGDDGKSPRTVDELHTDEDDLYKVTQNRGIDYIVNSGHILSLLQTQKLEKKTKGIVHYFDVPEHNVLDIGIEDYIQTSGKFRRKYSGFKQLDLDFSNNENLIIDPYYLGLWLGDGSSRCYNHISTGDREIIDYLKSIAKKFNANFTQPDKYTYNINSLKDKKFVKGWKEVRQEFYKLNLIQNKHIPEKYLRAKKEDRLRLLAGLIDSDGYDTRRNTLSICTINPILARDIVELIRTTGFWTNGARPKISKMKRANGTIYSVKSYNIELNHRDFKCLNKYIKVPRKRISKTYTHNRGFGETKIKVEYEGFGKYYGFSLKEDPHFLLEDGTIVHNSGKTMGILMLLHLICKYCPGIHIAVFRKSAENLKSSTIPSYRKVCKIFGDTPEVVDMIGRYDNESQIIFKWADVSKDPDHDNVKGFEYAIAYFNEANQIDRGYIDIAATRLGRWNDFEIGGTKFFLKPSIILDLNPTNCWIKSEFYDKFKAGTLPKDVFFQESVAMDNKYNPPEYFEFLKKLPPTEYSRYVENNWNYSDDPNQLIIWEWLKDCLIEKPTEFKPNGIGVDVAREGNDRTVFWYHQGNIFGQYETFKNQKTNITGQILIERAKERQIDPNNVSVDVVGVGSGVVDFCFSKGFEVQTYNSGNSASSTGIKSTIYNFKNRRAEDYWRLRDLIQNHEISILNDPEIIKELLNIRYFISEQNIQIESKRDMKKNFGYSPDLADALVIGLGGPRGEIVELKAHINKGDTRLSPSFEEITIFIREASKVRW